MMDKEKQLRLANSTSNPLLRSNSLRDERRPLSRMSLPSPNFEPGRPNPGYEIHVGAGLPPPLSATIKVNRRESSTEDTYILPPSLGPRWRSVQNQGIRRPSINDCQDAKDASEIYVKSILSRSTPDVEISDDKESSMILNSNWKKSQYSFRSTQLLTGELCEDFPLDRLRQWIHCFCVVNFDLEAGQNVELAYPSSMLKPEELKNIAFCSFPDNNSSNIGDMIFTFRTRYENSEVSPDGYLFGYVYFRQKPDPTIRRGYFQKSVVIISHLPYVGLFGQMIKLLGSNYFETGLPFLEAACYDIATWESPNLGKYYELPFIGTNFEVELSQYETSQLLETSQFSLSTYGEESHRQILASIPPGSALLYHFRDILPDLWLCWELMILAEPLVVIGTTPQVCSEVVFCLIDLIRPVQYCGDYRPFFTVQDSDFKYLVFTSKSPSKTVLGVTNPFFIRALEHWSHILYVGESRLPQYQKMNGNGVSNSTRMSSKKIDHVIGLTSKRKSIVEKDKKLLKTFAEAAIKGQPPDFVINNLLRRYFMELTENFLQPLNRYFSTLIPTNLTLSSSRRPPRLKLFRNEDFLKSLSIYGVPPIFKGYSRLSSTNSSQINIATGFYREFLQCSNFATWLGSKMEEANIELRIKYLKVLCEGNIKLWIQGKEEVELVDLLVRIKEELANTNTTSDDTNTTSGDTNTTSGDVKKKDGNLLIPSKIQLKQLENQAEKLISALPEDLRESLKIGV